MNSKKELGTTSVSSFELPCSGLLDDESAKVFERSAVYAKELAEKLSEGPLPMDLRGASPDQLPVIRQSIRDMVLSSAGYVRLTKKFKTAMNIETMGGVYTEVFTPIGGVAKKNRERVLINLHGGSFMGGERSVSHLESIPISAVGKIKVVSIDYRMAPEYQFPAASDDVLSVYKYLLKDYQPQNIGIYGSSAGALLTAQSLARFQEELLPLPAAAGMLAAAGYYWMEGDSGCIGSAINGIPIDSFGLDNDLYFKGVDENNALAFPSRHSEVLANFPPSLLVSSTRDFALSSVVKTHSQLTKLGVKADLHIWEGLAHVFYFDSELPESLELYDVLVNFFEKHLG